MGVIRYLWPRDEPYAVGFRRRMVLAVGILIVGVVKVVILG